MKFGKHVAYLFMTEYEIIINCTTYKVASVLDFLWKHIVWALFRNSEEIYQFFDYRLRLQIRIKPQYTCAYMPKKNSKISEEIPQPDISAFPVLVLGLCIIIIKWRHVQRYWLSSAFDTTRRKVFHGFYFTLLTLLKEEVYFNGRYISEWTRKCFTKG